MIEGSMVNFVSNSDFSLSSFEVELESVGRSKTDMGDLTKHGLWGCNMKTGK